jgi:hypothetical protein
VLATPPFLIRACLRLPFLLLHQPSARRLARPSLRVHALDDLSLLVELKGRKHPHVLVPFSPVVLRRFRRMLVRIFGVRMIVSTVMRMRVLSIVAR